MYITTSNNYSSPATKSSDAVIAMDLHSGKIQWSYQGTGNDAWNLGCLLPGGSICPKENGVDYDFGAAAILASSSDGHDYVLAGQKSGWVYALDPANGKLVWKTKVGRGGFLAGVHFGMAVRGDALYVPISDAPDGLQHSEPARPGMYALDIRTGKYLWKAPAEPSACNGRAVGCDPGIGSIISISDDLVLSGANDGRMRFYQADTGHVLWQYDTVPSIATVGGGMAQGGSIGGGAGPIAYDGTLVVESGYGFGGRTPGNLLLVFEVQ
jgi:polyvinyl alcohol dehydrogenase (cytochrome)